MKQQGDRTTPLTPAALFTGTYLDTALARTVLAVLRESGAMEILALQERCGCSQGTSGVTTHTSRGTFTQWHLDAEFTNTFCSLACHGLIDTTGATYNIAEITQKGRDASRRHGPSRSTHRTPDTSEATK